MSLISKLQHVCLLLLAFSLPFEWDKPLLSVGFLQLTNVEINAGIYLALTLLSRLQSPLTFTTSPSPSEGKGGKNAGFFLSRHFGERVGVRGLHWQTYLPHLLLALFTLALLISPLFIADKQTNALKAGLRTINGILLMVAIANTRQTPRQRTQLFGALIAGGTMALLLGLVEVSNGTRLALLDGFRLKPTVVGPFVRLTGSFDYANQTAMFLEAILPLTLWFGWSAWQKRQGTRAVFWAGLLLLQIQGVLLTYSRASLITLLGMAGIMVLFARRDKIAYATLGGLVVVLLGITLAFSPVMQFRFSSEENNDWYAAQIEVPAFLTITADDTLSVPVKISNNGIFTWHKAQAIPINLGATWTQLDGNRELDYRPRWFFDEPVRPNETTLIIAPVRAPVQAGDYLLQWDLVQENVIWFSERQNTKKTTRVTITPQPLVDNKPPPPTSDAIPMTEATVKKDNTAPIPGRSVLWRVAGQMWQTSPIFGIGLDNFRKLYAPYVPEGAWNDTVHTNNWYIETVVSLGLLGGIPFLLWLAWLGLKMWQTVRRSDNAAWQIALFAALITFFLHGFLDYFLLFNATGFLFWLLIGLFWRTVVKDDYDHKFLGNESQNQ